PNRPMQAPQGQPMQGAPNQGPPPGWPNQAAPGQPIQGSPNRPMQAPPGQPMPLDATDLRAMQRSLAPLMPGGPAPAAPGPTAPQETTPAPAVAAVSPVVPQAQPKEDWFPAPDGEASMPLPEEEAYEMTGEETLDMRFHVEKRQDPNIGKVIGDRYKIT